MLTDMKSKEETVILKIRNHRRNLKLLVILNLKTKFQKRKKSDLPKKDTTRDSNNNHSNLHNKR